MKNINSGQKPKQEKIHISIPGGVNLRQVEGVCCSPNFGAIFSSFDWFLGHSIKQNIVCLAQLFTLYHEFNLF
jgi:hypothetical protein